MEKTEKKPNKKKIDEKIVDAPIKQDAAENKTDAKKTEEKTKKPQIQEIKKTEARVNIKNAPVSTKYARDICRFIKNKQIEKAINDLDQVLVYKKAIPMRGGFGHQKSAKKFASGSGKYPMNAAKYFISLLKSLSANASVNGLENPVIVEAFGNVGQQPRARFGRWERKRTHMIIVAKSKNQIKKINNKDKKKN